MMPEPRAVIIGGGIGGMTVALRLQHHGWQVTLLERNPILGGKVREFSANGFRFDYGPSLITMKWVFEDFFRDIGARMEEYLEFQRISPLCRYQFHDGSVLLAHDSFEAFAEELQRFSPREVDAVRRYLRYVAQVYRVSEDVFLTRPFSFLSALRFAGPRAIRDLGKFASGKSLHDLHCAFFRDPRLVQLFDRFATYNGSDPWRTPSTFSVISHVEFAGGAWFPKGGIAAIPAALSRLMDERGVRVRYSTEATGLRLSQGRVNGVILADGSTLPADVVVVNQDALGFYEAAMEDVPAVSRKRRYYCQGKPSTTGFLLLIPKIGISPDLQHHNVFFRDDYKKEFHQITVDEKPPKDPTLYLSISAKTQISDAPEGCENWFVMVNVPALSPAWDWNQREAEYSGQIVKQLAFLTNQSAESLVPLARFTPVDFRDHLRCWKGALYGHASHSRSSAFLRPANRENAVQGLYFCGGSAHPGGGVPMVMLSASITSNLITGKKHLRTSPLFSL